jgi:hypothetical protein
MELLDHIRSTEASLNDVRVKTREAYNRLLSESRWIRDGNFRSIHSEDLQTLFKHYDELFFDGLLAATTKSANTPLSFRISKRMTRVGGTTTKYRHYNTPGRHASYEIAVSSTLLFTTFHDVDRSIVVSGIECKDRVEALQRIFEHELMHLAELMIWNDSSCSKRRFHSLSFQLFAHTESTHQLITPSERAESQFGIKTGDRVRFHHEGVDIEGFVNRITKRATVLVEDENCPLYSDGKRYAKFYIPVNQLETVK